MTTLAEMLQRPAWMADANCRGMDPGLFFPAQGEDAGHARAVCRACDVQAECLAFAVNNAEKFGIWGGVSEKRRRILRRDYGMSERRSTECGTEGGYQRHWREGEPACTECRAAHAAHVVAYRRTGTT